MKKKVLKTNVAWILAIIMLFGVGLFGGLEEASATNYTWNSATQYDNQQYILNTGANTSNVYKRIMKVGDTTTVANSKKYYVSAVCENITTASENIVTFTYPGAQTETNGDKQLVITANKPGLARVKFQWRTNNDTVSAYSYSYSYFEVIDGTTTTPAITLPDTNLTGYVISAIPSITMPDSRKVGDVITLNTPQTISGFTTGNSNILAVSYSGNTATIRANGKGTSYVKISFTSGVAIIIEMTVGYNIARVKNTIMSANDGHPGSSNLVNDQNLGDEIINESVNTNWWYTYNGDLGFSAGQFIMYRLDNIYDISNLTIFYSGSSTVSNSPNRLKVEICPDFHDSMNYNYIKGNGTLTYSCFNPVNYVEGGTNAEYTPVNSSNAPYVINNNSYALKEYYVIQQNWNWSTLYRAGGAGEDAITVTKDTTSGINYNWYQEIGSDKIKNYLKNYPQNTTVGAFVKITVERDAGAQTQIKDVVIYGESQKLPLLQTGVTFTGNNFTSINTSTNGTPSANITPIIVQYDSNNKIVDIKVCDIQSSASSTIPLACQGSSVGKFTGATSYSIYLWDNTDSMKPQAGTLNRIF